MVVQHNVTAMNANRNLGVTTGSQSKSAEKLSSGYQINRAADDAAGLSISEKMRKQIRGLDRASTNADDGVSSVQTAEGALTEVHDMLQRMNELAVQAANGTNSANDRTSIQNEIDQLTTEIDRVAETTKFNETYLLKGQTGFRQKVMAAHDAGLEGTLSDNLTEKGGIAGGAATFTAEVKTDTDKTIAGKTYHIYDKSKDTIDKMQGDLDTEFNKIKNTDGKLSANLSITINGASYQAAAASQDKTQTVFKLGEEEFTLDQIKAKIVDGAKVDISVDGKASANGTRTAVDTSLDKNISVATAVNKMAAALLQANRIGVDQTESGDNSVPQNKVEVRAYNTSDKDGKGKQISKNGADGKDVKDALEGTYTFSISKGTAQVAKDLGLQLHVGADADMTNKITIGVEAMTAKNLGVQNLNVVDNTGMAATYAIDAIEDAIKTVSSQRSALGAVQNRLEHTIKNLDNVVENTTAAESRIRDTDMADEMVTYSKNNILAQAGQSMLAQANQSNQGVLSLLG
ncbi:flagellin N-terminal helical domain-containing protein [Butyrivibrio sp. AC2005]|uniref:flagellin N-terminal helical domain-containing protein n=1 Tax=Butyrivibrio sp. AC2005 TaxID=1280672 RepID=UPI0004099F57|nr:flagellin [Butyrivibrio sp. AC2005]